MSRPVLRAATAAVLGLATVVGVVSAPADAVAFTPGAAGLGDPYFPKLGNGGYDVAHYDLDLAYDTTTHQLSGTATIRAHATQNLSRFDLDLSGMTVRGVTVNGAAADHTEQGGELVITPNAGIRDGRAFTVAVSYDGVPQTITGSPIVFGADYGWQYTPDGAFVGDEPNAAHTWFPSNDHPSDKATYTFDITVPKGTKVVANGELQNQSSTATSATFEWDQSDPMATYLATIDIGKWVFKQGTSPAGIPEFVAYDPDLTHGVNSRHTFDLSGEVTDYWSQTFGEYPFHSTGAIVDNVPNVGFSLETQSRPLYGFAPDQGTLSHELAHQWFGDSVSVATWRDIWLNEGFATFSQWIWSYEHSGNSTTYAVGRGYYNQISQGSSFWNQSIGDPKRNTMFSSAVYYRGAMTLAALRHLVGDADFFDILQTWVADHRHGNASTEQFIALAEQVSGMNLHRFFKIWLYDQVKPSSFDAH